MGQRVELTWMETGRHQVIARPLGRRLEQDGRLHFEEPSLIEEIANVFDNPVAQFQVFSHPVAAQVQVAVLKPHHLIDLRLLVDYEGGRPSLVQDLDPFHLDLNEARRQFQVLAPLRPPADASFDRQHPFRPRSLGRLMGSDGQVRVGHYLHQAPAVAQIDEGDAAVVSPPMHPSRQAHALANVLLSQLTTGVGL